MSKKRKRKSLSLNLPTVRKAGHYVVEDLAGNRTIAYWCGRRWQFIGDASQYQECDIDIKIYGELDLEQGK
jgi:hypothetical protein